MRATRFDKVRAKLFSLPGITVVNSVATIICPGCHRTLVEGRATHYIEAGSLCERCQGEAA